MKFEIIYQLKGVRKIHAVVPDSVQLPSGWEGWSPEIKNAWIYENQTSSEFVFEDIHHAEAESIEWAD